jgi:hypothetical protein
LENISKMKMVFPFNYKIELENIEKEDPIVIANIWEYICERFMHKTLKL